MFIHRILKWSYICDYLALKYVSDMLHYVCQYMISSYILSSTKSPMYELIRPNQVQMYNNILQSIDPKSNKLVKFKVRASLVPTHVRAQINVHMTAVAYLIVHQVVQDESISLSQMKSSVSKVLFTDSGLS